MKCNYCGSKWEVSKSLFTEITECPFCHSKIKLEGSSVKEVLRWIVANRSIDVLLNADIINAILADMAKDNEKERKTIKLALFAGAGKEFHRIWTRSGGKFFDSDVREITVCIEELGFDKNFASYVVDAFIYAVSYTSMLQDNLTCDVSNLYREGLELYKKEDYKEAFQIFRMAAEQGDLFACVILGGMYQDGIGVQKNLAEAYNQYKFAADKGDAQAQSSLGYLYEHGVGVKQDSDEAVRLYRLSAEQGNVSGENNLGTMYYNGRGVAQNYYEAIKWFELSAEGGFCIAQYWLAHMYYNGYGVEKNYSKALKWYIKSAEMGTDYAQYEIGNMYFYGNGVKQDYSEAVKWWRKAAEKGYSSIYFEVGYIYQYGLGVDRNLDEAIQWYSKPASKGNMEAQSALGSLYQRGIGVSIDHKEAMKWTKLAADQGYARAQNNLGVIYYLRGEEDPQNYVEALRWFKIAADQGVSPAMFNIGLMYERGLGVGSDINEAIKWYEKGAEKGNKDAKDKLLGFEETRRRHLAETLSEYLVNKEPKELYTATYLPEVSKRIDKKVPNYRGIDDEELRKAEWPFDSLF